jgi:hypothetical protein
MIENSSGKRLAFQQGECRNSIHTLKGLNECSDFVQLPAHDGLQFVLAVTHNF